MQRHEWTLIVFISCVFVLETAIYGQSMATEIFTGPPEIPITTWIVAFPDVGNPVSGWMATRDPNQLIQNWKNSYANRSTGGLNGWIFRTVESTDKNITKGGAFNLEDYRTTFWGAFTTYAYVLTDEEVKELGIKSTEIPSMETGWLESVKKSVSATTARLWQYAQMIWKLVSFDIPELPYYIRYAIGFPIWIALIFLAIDVVSRILPFG